MNAHSPPVRQRSHVLVHTAPALTLALPPAHTHILPLGPLQWRGGVKEGQGSLRFADGTTPRGGGGATYEGEWRGGKREGRGVARSANGDVYEGGL